MVDASGSITERDPEGWTRVKEFITEVVQSFDVGVDRVRVAITVFSNEAESYTARGGPTLKVWGLLDYTVLGDLVDRIGRLEYVGGFTNTQDALRVARAELLQPPGDRANVQNLVIVITDGVSNVRVDRLEPEARELQRVATVIAIGVTDQISIDELNLIASEDASGRELTLFADEFNLLSGQIQNLLDETCAAVVPTAPPRPGENKELNLMLDHRLIACYNNYTLYNYYNLVCLWLTYLD